MANFMIYNFVFRRYLTGNGRKIYFYDFFERFSNFFSIEEYKILTDKLFLLDVHVILQKSVIANFLRELFNFQRIFKYLK